MNGEENKEQIEVQETVLTNDREPIQDRPSEEQVACKSVEKIEEEQANEASTEAIKEVEEVETDMTYAKEEDSIQHEEKRQVLKSQKRSYKQWLSGIAVASLCAGIGIGVGFSFTTPLQSAYYKKVLQTENTNLSPEEVDEIVAVGNQNTQQTYVSQALPPECDGSIVSIAKSVGPSIVSVYNNKKIMAEESIYFYNSSEEMVTGLGSGIIFDEDEDKYYIMTNSHVVEGADSIAINFVGDNKSEAKLVGKDSVNDIAVVYVNKNKLSEETKASIRIAALGDSDTIEVGQLAIAIGTPATEALNNTVTTGIISAVERNIIISGNAMKVIQTDAAINPGNSGGALVGPTGEIIGMNVAKTVNTEGIGFSIPINKVKEVVADLMVNGSVIRPGLGITGIAVSDTTAGLYDLPVGVYIQTVIKGGSADLAGIKANDVLIQFDGEMITNMEQLKGLIAQKRVGDLVEVKVIRNGEQKSFKLELKEMPSS